MLTHCLKILLLLTVPLMAGGCGVGGNSASQQVGSLTLPTSPIAINGTTCGVSVEMFNTVNQDIILQSLQIIMTGQESGATKTQTFSAADLQQYLTTLYLSLGSPLQFDVPADVTSIADANIDLALVLISTTPTGTPVVFSGNCICSKS